MDRRRFLQNSGLAIGAATLPALKSLGAPPTAPAFGTWQDIRAQFNLRPGKIHMSQMLLASHPEPVRRAIEMHREEFDQDAVGYWEANWQTAEIVVQKAAAAYLQCDYNEVALTDSTSMGLSMLYSGLLLKPGDEILTSTHDHYATEKSLEFAAGRNGASIRRIVLYKDPSQATADEIVSAVRSAIRPATRIVALTWVHSSTGVKTPIRAIADVIAAANAGRDSKARIYFCVDGVHGFGVDDITMGGLGCDFFAAGTHKWIFGPRGTGILFARKDASDMVRPVIPAFSFNAYGEWLNLYPADKLTFGDVCTPGGFHSFEHRWSLNKAFEWQMTIGKEKVQNRTRQLSTMLKNGLREMKHVKLHTPVSVELSAGINCFEVNGLTPDQVVAKLAQKNITASSSPYKTSYARLTPSIVNSEEEVMTALKAIEGLKAG